MKFRSVLAVVLVSVLALACSSKSSTLPAGPDAGSSPDLQGVIDTAAAPEAAAVDTAVMDTAVEAAEAGPPVVVPTPGAPPVMGDGKLVDPVDEGPGGDPDGWDFCGPGGLVAAPRAGKNDPPARRGMQYLLHSTADLPPTPDAAGALAQAYFYFGAGLPVTGKGLWFDAVRVSGTASARLALYSVDKLCQRAVGLGTYALDALLVTPGQWNTTCVDMPAGVQLEGLGIRVEAGSAEVGLDAFRFGPACPVIR